MLLTINSPLLWILVLVILGFFALLGYVLARQQLARDEKKVAEKIAKLIIEYFQKTGVSVSVNCIRRHSKKQFTALIESEPMKQFRLSHIIESTLREHIKKTCGEQLENIYWRFPIKESTLDKGEDGADKPKKHTDEYINEGLLHYKDVPKMEVTELSWEKFEEVATLDSETNPARDEPPAKT